MKYYDQHIHSSFSKDSEEDLENYFIRAKENGIEYVITCEHFDPHTSVDGTSWDADYDALIAYQKKLKKKYPMITPLLGIELGYRKEYMDEMEEKLINHSFDLVQLSVHDSGVYDFYYPEFYHNPSENLNGYFDLVLEAITNWTDYDVLSHIDFAFKTARYVMKDIQLKEFEEKVTKILLKLINDEKALEINTKVQETIDDELHVKYLLLLYKKLGGYKVTLSSDAHSQDRYLSSFDKYIKLIKSCGFDELRYYIKRKEYIFKI